MGHHDWSVILAEARATIEENVFIAQPRIGSETQRGHVVRFGKRCFVQRLNIIEYVRVFVSRRVQLVRGQGLKHEGIIGVRRMRQLDFARFGEGF